MWADGRVKRLSKTDTLRNNFKCLLNMSKKKKEGGGAHLGIEKGEEKGLQLLASTMTST